MYGLVLCVVLFLPNLVLVFRASLARYYPTLSKITFWQRTTTRLELHVGHLLRTKNMTNNRKRKRRNKTTDQERKPPQDRDAKGEAELSTTTTKLTKNKDKHTSASSSSSSIDKEPNSSQDPSSSSSSSSRLRLWFLPCPRVCCGMWRFVGFGP